MNNTKCIAIGGKNYSIGFNDPVFDPRIIVGVEGINYNSINIGQIDLLEMQKQMDALRNEVDFLKSALHRVLAEESYKDMIEELEEGKTD